jgi:hypothetical protein
MKPQESRSQGRYLSPKRLEWKQKFHSLDGIIWQEHTFKYILKTHETSPSTFELMKSVLTALLQELFSHTTGCHVTSSEITFQHPSDPLLLANRVVGAPYTQHRLWQHDIQYQRQSLDYSQMSPHAPVEVVLVPCTDNAGTTCAT